MRNYKVDKIDFLKRGNNNLYMCQDCTTQYPPHLFNNKTISYQKYYFDFNYRILCGVLNVMNNEKLLYLNALYL